MKKVVIIYDFLHGFGGLERVMGFQAESLKKSFDVSLSFASFDKSISEKMFPGIEVNEHSRKFLKFGFLKIMWTFLNRASLNKYKDSSLFISHSYLCSRLCYYMKKNYNIPYIIYLHHPPNFLYMDDKRMKYVGGFDIGRTIALVSGIFLGRLMRPDDIKCVKNADAVFVNSVYTKNRAEQIYNIKPVVCYPTINSIFKPLSKRSCEYVLKKYNINKKFIISHGRLIPDKRYELLVESLEYFKDKDFLIVFSGKIDDFYRLELINIAKKLKVENNIKFLGFIPDDDLVALNNLAEVFAYPSVKEDFGIVPVEAMACGCPVVAWDDGAGPSEIIINNVNGLLAKPYDLKDFASKIELILNSGFKVKNKSKIVKSTDRFSRSNCSKMLNSSINVLLQK
ncbi:MAG: glycosyltransferase family 4 protein [Nanoarchaeota archaeon]